MRALSVSQRIRIVKLGFQAQCAVLNKPHLAYMAKYAVLPHEFAFLPDSVHACEDIGRRALHEYLEEGKEKSA